MTENITIDWSKIPSIDVRQPRSIANVISMFMPVAKDLPQDGKPNFYWYENGIYRNNGELAIREMYKRIMEEGRRGDDWRAGFATKVIEYMEADAATIMDRPTLNNINLLNGIYDWRRDVLVPHRPAYRTMIQLPIIYDPTATCPHWDEFLSEILPGGDTFLLEVIALCMIPFTDLQKSIVLVGTGSNGKSTYLNGLQRLIGGDNCCHVSLQSLTNSSDRFSKSRLVGKLVNIQGDLPLKKIEEASTFKLLTGEDAVEFEYKGRGHFKYYSYARLIFSCNQVVRSDDDTEGYKRRFIHVPFTQKFNVNPEKAKILKHYLNDPQEISGLFNKAVARLDSITSQGFTISPYVAAIIDDWAVIEDEVKGWLQANVEYDSEGVIPSTLFYAYYTRWCPTADMPYTRQKTIRNVKNVFPGIQANVNTTVNGKQVRCYRGIRMKNPGVQADFVRLTRMNDPEEVEYDNTSSDLLQ